MTNKDRFLAIVTDHSSDTLAFNQYLVDNRFWLQASQHIAVKALMKLAELGWSQKHLAEQLKVSPQYVSKLLSGQENMTLETLVKLQTLLDIPVLATYNEAKLNELQAKIKRLEKKVSTLKTQLDIVVKPDISKEPRNKKVSKKSNVV